MTIQCRLKQCEFNMLNPINFSQECIGCNHNKIAHKKYIEILNEKWGRNKMSEEDISKVVNEQMRKTLELAETEKSKYELSKEEETLFVQFFTEFDYFTKSVIESCNVTEVPDYCDNAEIEFNPSTCKKLNEEWNEFVGERCFEMIKVVRCSK